jgi:drug/metabolite transporter (DMT)-like permease
MSAVSAHEPAADASAFPPPPWALAVAFGVIYLSWGTTYYAVKLGVQRDHLPPFLFGGTRIVLAGAIILAYQVLTGARLRLAAADLLRLYLISALLFIAGNGLITYGQKTVDSSIAAVLVATTPLWIGLMAMFWRHGERLTPRGWTGLVVGLAGVLVLLAPKALASDASFDLRGSLLVIGSAGAWALGSILLRHVSLPVPRLTIAAYQMLLGGASMLVLGTLIGEAGEVPEQLSPQAIQVFLYLLIVGSLGGFVAFNWLLGHVSAAKVGTYAYVNPLVAVLIGWLMGEEVSWGLWAGMAIILFGVFLVRGGERRGVKA